MSGDMACFVDAATVARHLGVDRNYVYSHAAELGAIRLGTGPKARLRCSDEATVLILAGLLARVETMQAYVEKNGVFDARGRVRPVMRILLSTETAALKAADSLGLNTRSRVALGLDAAQGSALTEYLKERYGTDGDE